ncbi:hypothetical protein [Mucilaginibacter psychrotolerans]|uniref:Uncharacterized protein n=1 Tax=Mucilaginibacter psychrotolerans TaxID=1524096 RepID=A0A4Y8S2L6_9SPHI|nr:hypothetical protein [Mucilaginibacter psychrotolerans]TFF33288.1 hypothetical protein E2R66_26785 [Mucilaginibacter psychrotolerans]
MSELSSNLRLQLAQLNNFLIENYLSKLESQGSEKDPYAYLFNSFLQLSQHLAAIGSTIGSLGNLPEGSLLPLKEAITKAVDVVYLIEKANGIDELTSYIEGINTAILLNSIKNISAYGKQFGIVQAEIDAEIKELKQDNSAYFNIDGTLKFESYEFHFDEAIAYLSHYAAVSRVKNAFKKIADTYQYFSSMISVTSVADTNYTGNKAFIGNLLNTLTVLLIALSYVEPFFQKSTEITQIFERHIIDITSTQTSLLNELL